MKLTQFLILLTMVLAQAAMADSSTVQDCLSIKQLSRTRTRCQTSKGFEFVRTKNGWKDAISGITWYDDMSKGVTWYTIRSSCKSKNLDLPSVEDFKMAEQHGFREVLKNIEDNGLWSGSDDYRDSRIFGNAYWFHNGEIFSAEKESHIWADSAICVTLESINWNKVTYPNQGL